VKGVLFLHLRSYVSHAYPRVRWNDVMSECGIAQLFAAGWDYPDRTMNCIVDAVCRAERVSHAEFWYEFGKHSMVEFRKNYHWYFDQNPDARAFLLSLDDIHLDAVRHIDGAHPPRFTCHLTPDRRELTISYRSRRGMVDYLRGAIEGILTIYGEQAQVSLGSQGDGAATFVVRFA